VREGYAHYGPQSSGKMGAFRDALLPAPGARAALLRRRPDSSSSELRTDFDDPQQLAIT